VLPPPSAAATVSSCATLVAPIATSALLSWSTLTASVPSVPAATLVIWRSAPTEPTEIVLSRSATEYEPSAALLAPVAKLYAPRAVL
jgi:hypothetical protein